MKKLLSMVLACAMTLSCLTLPALAAEEPAQHFKDVSEKHWGYEYVERAYEDGAIKGTGGNPDEGTGTFDPDGTVTVGQYLAIMTNAFFPDDLDRARKEGHTDFWYSPALAVAKEHSLFLHTTTGPAGADDYINRYNMSVILYNVLQALDFPIPPEAQLEIVARSIPDYGVIPGRWTARCVKTVVYLGLITGMNQRGLFAGRSLMTRAQAAVIYTKTADLLESRGIEY